MIRLLLYHDFASAFSRVALSIAIEAAGATGRTLELVPFERFPAPAPRPAPEEAFGAELAAAAELAGGRGLEMSLPGLVPRTRKAHEAVAHAREHGAEAAMAEALYDALWRQGLDIGRLDVLATMGTDVGIDGGALHVALGVDADAPEVERAQRQAERDGIRGVPTFRFGDAVAVGLLPAAELIEWVEALATGRSDGSP
jgi:predicted DsbA family dithiol-disulfide isomerase